MSNNQFFTEYTEMIKLSRECQLSLEGRQAIFKTLDDSRIPDKTWRDSQHAHKIICISNEQEMFAEATKASWELQRENN